MAGSTWGDSLTTAHGFPDLGSEVRGKLPRKALVPALSQSLCLPSQGSKSPVSAGTQGRNRSLWMDSSSQPLGEFPSQGVEEALDYSRSHGGGDKTE